MKASTCFTEEAVDGEYNSKRRLLSLLMCVSKEKSLATSESISSSPAADSKAAAMRGFLSNTVFIPESTHIS